MTGEDGQPVVPADCHRCAYAADLGAEVKRLREALRLISQDMALSAESHRIIAQDILGGFKERGER